jgi:predicted DNA binding CopG/RHH family protein
MPTISRAVQGTRINTHETVGDFIGQRLQEQALKQMLRSSPSSSRNVTVRLPKGEIAAIDKVAEFLDLSRQELLFELIGASMEQAITAIAAKLREEDRTEWVQEIVGLWTAHDVELEGQADE